MVNLLIFFRLANGYLIKFTVVILGIMQCTLAILLVYVMKKAKKFHGQVLWVGIET